MRIYFVPVDLKIRGLLPVRAQSMKRARKTAETIFWKKDSDVKNAAFSKMACRSIMSCIPKRLAVGDSLNIDRKGTERFFNKLIRDGDQGFVKESLR